MQPLKLHAPQAPVPGKYIGTGLNNLDGALSGGYLRKGTYAVTSRTHKCIWDFMGHAAHYGDSRATLYMGLPNETSAGLVSRLAHAASGVAPGEGYTDARYLRAVQELPDVYFGTCRPRMDEVAVSAESLARDLARTGDHLDLVIANLMVAPDWSGNEARQAKRLALTLNCAVLMSVWVKERNSELKPSYGALDAIISVQEHCGRDASLPLTLHVNQTGHGHQKHRVSARYHKTSGALWDD